MSNSLKKRALCPKGFLFSTAEAAIKKPGKKDLALIYSDMEAVMSGMFTTNRIKAAPVKLDIRRIKSAKGQAIIVNSGNANACTGERGMMNAKQSISTAASVGPAGRMECEFARKFPAR